MVQSLQGVLQCISFYILNGIKIYLCCIESAISVFSFIIHDLGIHSILDQLLLNYISSSHQALNHIGLNVATSYTKIDENFAITFF